MSPANSAAGFRPRIGRELDLTRAGVLQSEYDKENWVGELKV